MKCPVCALTIDNPMPSFCPRCAWDFKNDLTLNTFLSAPPEKDLTAYRQRLEIARKNWVYIQDMKKKQNAKDSNPEPPQKILPAKNEDHDNRDRDQRLSNSQNFQNQPIREKEQTDTYCQVSSEKEGMDDRVAPTRQKCPLCGMRNDPEDTFQCRICGKDYLCRDHFIKEQLCCQDCTTIKSRYGRFIIHNNDIVEDTVSGLEWVRTQKETRYFLFDEVQLQINRLNIGGGGWRFPTRLELDEIRASIPVDKTSIPLLEFLRSAYDDPITVNYGQWSGKDHCNLCAVRQHKL